MLNYQRVVDDVDLPNYKMGGFSIFHRFLYVYQAGYMVQEALLNIRINAALFHPGKY
jgi:hypothetical protein